MIVNVLENTGLNSDFESEKHVNHFKNIAKEYFQFLPDQETNYLNYIKEYSRLYNYSLPSNVNEIFIKYEEAYLFWLCKSSLSIYLDELIKNYFPNGYDTTYVRIKEFYQKWVFIKSDTEKKYFAVSAINFIEKNLNKKNFVNHILHAVILLYDKNLFDPLKSLELLQKAREIVETAKLKQIYDVEIKYLIKVYEGFVYLKLNQYDNAVTSFNNALFLKPFGITAKYYLALIEAATDHIDSAKFLLKEIITFDLYRIEFAIENNNYTLFKNFLKNSVFQNIFLYDDFAILSEYIEGILLEIKTSDNQLWKNLAEKYKKIKDLRLEAYYDQKINSSISFLDHITRNQEQQKNILFSAVLNKIQERVGQTIESLREAIQQKFYLGVKEKLKSYDEQIEDCNNKINFLKKQLELELESLKERLAAGIRQIETSTEEKLQIIEERIQSLPLEKNLNPGNAFSSTMTYTFIVSLIVFLISGYSGSFMSNEFEFDDVVRNIFGNGLKWGIVTFLIGFVISIIAAGFVSIEKMNKKQRLTQMISYLKNERDYDKNAAKKEFDEKESILNENYSDEIESYKARIKKLLSDKEIREEDYKKEADKEIESIIKEFDSIDITSAQS